RRLDDVHPGDGEIGIVHLAVAQVAVEETAANVVRVGQVMISGRDDGDLLLRLADSRPRLAARIILCCRGVGGKPRGSRSGGEEEIAARNVGCSHKLFLYSGNSAPSDAARIMIDSMD